MTGIAAVGGPGYAAATAAQAGGNRPAAAAAAPAVRYDPDHDGDTDKPGKVDVKA